MSTNARAEVLDLIQAERERQDAKWGEQNHEDFIWLGIHGEEYGEVCQAVLEDRFGGPHAGTVEEELVQLAATCIQHLECIQRRKVKKCAVGLYP